MNDHEKKLALYDSWANKLLLRSLDQLPNPPPNPLPDRILKLASHLVAAKEMWLARLYQQDTSALQIWPTIPDLVELATRLAKADAALIALTVNRADLKSPIRYTNAKGDSFSESPRDIITHMVNHSTYHRGQLATAIKEANGQPPSTDYILWIRSFPNSTPILPS